MTFTEIMSIIIGGFLGYWIIDSLINRVSSKPNSNNEEDAYEQTKQSSSRADTNSIQDTWFRILDVSRGASKEEITLAYKKKISQYHPDKVSSLGDELKILAEEKSKAINAAYDYAMKIR